MFKRKKFMALCATTLAGISALGSFAPMAASADVAKNGDTVVTYEGAPKPAEWGLSVPSTIRLDADSNNVKWGTGKLEIVSEDGSTFQDKTKDRTFSIDGTPTLISSKFQDVFMIFKDGVDPSDATNYERSSVFITILDQGATEPTTWSVEGAETSPSVLKNIEIVSMSDNSKSPSRILTLGASNPLMDWATAKLSNTIQWTATEKTS